MPSLDDLRKRITSVKSTQKITKAMKMVAAAKLRKAQENAEKGRPYSEKMNNVILNLSKSITDKENAPKLLVGTGEEKVHLCIVLTADRGLCGGFNSSINRETTKYIRSLEKDSKNVTLLTIGKKSRDFFNRIMKDKIIESYVDLGAKGAGYDTAIQISNKIQSLYFDNQFDVCVLVYNKFKSVIVQEVTQQQLIPLDITNKEEIENKEKIQDNSIYTYEPDEESILQDLLPKNVSIQIFKILLESNAGEQGARMVAMDNATRNAGEMIDSLTLKYNRTRQAFITKELIEIISGAESV